MGFFPRVRLIYARLNNNLDSIFEIFGNDNVKAVIINKPNTSIRKIFGNNVYYLDFLTDTKFEEIFRIKDIKKLSTLTLGEIEAELNKLEANFKIRIKKNCHMQFKSPMSILLETLASFAKAISFSSSIEIEQVILDIMEAIIEKFVGDYYHRINDPILYEFQLSYRAGSSIWFSAFEITLFFIEDINGDFSNSSGSPFEVLTPRIPFCDVKAIYTTFTIY